jgi:hypothetical protein
MKTKTTYNEKFEAWRSKSFDLKPSEANATKLLSLSLLFEAAKNDPTKVSELHAAIILHDKQRFKDYPDKKVSSCVYLEEGDLVLDFGQSMFFIEDAEAEIKDKIYWGLWGADWDRKFSSEDDRKEACQEAAKEELARFDLIDYATSNLSRWEVSND